MCPPDHFAVAYVINPWMEGQTARTRPDLALRQWTALREAVERRAKVSLLPAQAGLPDLVFTANAGLVRRGRAVPSRFRFPERQREEAVDRSWFVANGFEITDLPPDVVFEGAGDALYDEAHDLLWVGCGFRSDPGVAPLLQDLFGVRAIEVRLIDPRFYHLDTCLCPLPGGRLMVFPAAFDEPSQARIKAIVPESNLLAVDEVDAQKFCCNAVVLGDVVILNDASPALLQRLQAAGLAPVLTPLSEFIRAGGSAKCLTLAL